MNLFGFIESVERRGNWNTQRASTFWSARNLFSLFAGILKRRLLQLSKKRNILEDEMMIAMQKGRELRLERKLCRW